MPTTAPSLCNFFHDFDLFEMVFGVVAIAIEGPVMVLYSVAEDVGFSFSLTLSS